MRMTQSAVLHGALLFIAGACTTPIAAVSDGRCDPANGGITLPEGFCASVFADSVGVARHLVVTPAGDVYVALESARRPSANVTHMRGPLGQGGIVALRDTNRDGRADLRLRISTDHGSGIALYGDSLYFSTITTVVRYRLVAGELAPAGPPDTIVTGFPDTGGHSSRSLAFDDTGSMYVNIGSDTDACRPLGERGNLVGQDPCPELAERAGIWRFSTARLRQQYAGVPPFATGIRNAMGLAWNARVHALFATQHGRDGLSQLWPRLYSARKSADTPSEELLRVEQGDDFGWPYCYHDREFNRRVLAPEYGGDAKKAGRCATRKEPLIGLPGHWAPNALLFYEGAPFPPRYAGGAFIAFHGSWNRPTSSQAGYLIAFVPFADGSPAGPHEVFADGFAAGQLSPGGAMHRPVGLAVGPDGTMHVSDDARGRIWRIVYVGP